MKRKLLSVIIASSLIFSIIPVYEPVHASGIAEIIKSVSFRDQPSTSGERIRYIQAGEKVEIIENVNTYWNKVVDQYGQVGYLTTLEQYVTVLSQPEIQPEVQTGNATILLSVSFREGPSTSYNRVRYLQAGETITILSEYSSYWYHIKDQHGQEGYVSTISKYIDASGYLDTVPEPVTNGEILKSVSFRSGPSTSYSRIRYLQTGEKVTVLDKANSYWYEVQDQNGQVGYVTTISGYMSTSYVDNQEPVTTAPDSDTNDQTKSEIIQNVIDVGMKYLGTPYEFGSDRNSTATFDCSDLVRRIFIEGANITLPMDSRKQADYVSQVGQTSSDWNNLQPGDLMFFMSYKGSSSDDYIGIDKSSETITHVSLYLGDGQVLHTYSAKSGGVKTDTIAGRHWEHRFIFGGSVIK